MLSKSALTGFLVLLISLRVASSSLSPCQGEGSCRDQVESTGGQVLLQQQTLQKKISQDESLDNEVQVEDSTEDDAEMDDEFDDADVDEELSNHLEDEEDEDEDSEGHEDGEEEQGEDEDRDSEGDENDEAEQEEDLEEEERSGGLDEDPLSMRQDDMLVVGESVGEGQRGKGKAPVPPAPEAPPTPKGNPEKPKGPAEKPKEPATPADSSGSTELAACARGRKGRRCRKARRGKKKARATPAPEAAPAQVDSSGSTEKPKVPATPADSSESTEKPKAPKLKPDGIDYTQKVTVGCAAENAFRKAIKESRDHTGRLGPQILRMIFHDSVDENNLLLKNKETEKWEPIISATGGTYGGVDGCLYSPLSKGSQGVPEPSHNRNLPSSFGFAQKLCKQFCQEGKVKEGLCRSMPDCIVDMTVLGSIVTVEAVGGPKIPMTWGRKKGKCSKVIETPFSKDLKAMAKYINKPALAGAPSLTGIDDAKAFRDSFQKLGFDPVDQVALMGAHTFGKLQVCAGGLNGVEAGPFCNDPSKLSPPLTEANIVPNCKPKLGIVSNCWTQSADKKKLAPLFATAGQKGFGMAGGFGDGGFFDRTPTKFDNDYFKLFANETYEGKDVCCGKTKGGGCHRGGRGMPMAKVTKRSENGLASASVNVGGPCDHNWCRSDRKGRTHMKSVKAWHEAPHDFVKAGYHHGVTKRMIRLAGDWALLGNPETETAVKKFAESQSAFFDAFTVAWGKVINKGYESLRTCDDADTSVPTMKLANSNPSKKTQETGTGSFRGDGKGCRDKHRKCHTFSPTSKPCTKARWQQRCPFTCKKCPN